MGGIAWSEEEDHLLKKCIQQYGEGKWYRIPLLSGLHRCPKSCRLRWMNYLRPNIQRGSFADDEIDLIFKLHKLLRNRQLQPQYHHHPCLEEMPHLQPSQEESSSSSTPLILQQPELEQSQNVEINEDVNFGDDLLVDFDLDFDFEQVILTDDYHLSNK
ncbi:hypothetical protein QYF36_001273 [Acer negundo]|nr:hypothetical protein QYF36_001273 [Acer negundo]